MHALVIHSIQLESVDQFFICFRTVLPDITHHIDKLSDPHVLRISSNLGHVSYAFAVSPVTKDSFPLKFDFSGSGNDKSENGLYQSSFSGTIRTDQSIALPPHQVECEIVQGNQFSKTLCYMLNRDHVGSSKVNHL